MKKLFMFLCVVIMLFGIVGCPDSNDSFKYSKLGVVNNGGSNTSGASQFSSFGDNTSGVSQTSTVGNNTSGGPGGSPVPEPTTMLLLGAGLVGLAGFGRKRFKK